MPLKLSREFIMDGLLIDSEELWRETETEVFGSLGIELNEEMTRETTGMRCDEVVDHWFNRYPWDSVSKEDIETQIIGKIVEKVKERGNALPGVFQTLSFFGLHNIPMAIASSSPEKIIEAVIDKFSLHKHISLYHSADNEEFGKPHPGVFIGAAKRLGMHPANCIVFEDSINGMIAAKAARMRCIGVPDKVNRTNPKLSIADVILDSLEDLH